MRGGRAGRVSSRAPAVRGVPPSQAAHVPRSRRWRAAGRALRPVDSRAAPPAADLARCSRPAAPRQLASTKPVPQPAGRPASTHLNRLCELCGRGVQGQLDGIQRRQRRLLARHLRAAAGAAGEWVHGASGAWRRHGRRSVGGPVSGGPATWAGPAAASGRAPMPGCRTAACRTLLSSVPKRRDVFRRRGAATAAAAGLAARLATDSASSAATSTAAARSGASRGCCCCTRAPLPRWGAAARKGCTCTRAELHAAILPELVVQCAWRAALWPGLVVACSSLVAMHSREAGRAPAPCQVKAV